MSKDSLIKGTLILTLAAFVARFLGVVQRIPLKHLLGDSGMGTYSIAFNIYMLLFTIATAGLPSAVSKLVSERLELGRNAEANRIFKASVYFALVSGVLMTVFLYYYAPFQAARSHDENAVLPIRALAPALLLFPLTAIIRGYFQGRQRMMPNGLSQIVEQILRVGTSIALAFGLLAAGWGDVWAIAGASFGGVMGTIGAVAVLIYFLLAMRKEDRAEGIDWTAGEAEASRISYSRIYKVLFTVSVPIVIFSITVPLINYIDSSIVIPLLQDQVGKALAHDILGQLAGRAQSLAGLPIILAIAISQSIVPIISSAYAKKDMRQVGNQAGKALQLALITGLPMVLLIAIGARPINSLIFGDPLGTGTIVVLTITSLFQVLMQTSGAILMGLGEMKPLVGHVVIGIVIKIAFSYALAPVFGIYGIVGATAMCFMAMAALNQRTLRKKIDFQIFTRKRWTRLLLTCVAIGGIGVLLEQTLHAVMSGIPFYLNYFLQSCIIGVYVLVLYPLLLGLTRVVTGEDLKTYPASIQKLVRKVGRLIGR